MKPRPPKKPRSFTLAGKFHDIFDEVEPGQAKEVDPGTWVIRTGVILEPPEPIKKPRQGKQKKK
jgi:hypothetical protein